MSINKCSCESVAAALLLFCLSFAHAIPSKISDSIAFNVLNITDHSDIMASNNCTQQNKQLNILSRLATTSSLNPSCHIRLGHYQLECFANFSSAIYSFRKALALKFES